MGIEERIAQALAATREEERTRLLKEAEALRYWPAAEEENRQIELRALAKIRSCAAEDDL